MTLKRSLDPFLSGRIMLRSRSTQVLCKHINMLLNDKVFLASMVYLKFKIIRLKKGVEEEKYYFLGLRHFLFSSDFGEEMMSGKVKFKVI